MLERQAHPVDAGVERLDLERVLAREEVRVGLRRRLAEPERAVVERAVEDRVGVERLARELERRRRARPAGRGRGDPGLGRGDRGTPSPPTRRCSRTGRPRARRTGGRRCRGPCRSGRPGRTGRAATGRPAACGLNVPSSQQWKVTGLTSAENVKVTVESVVSSCSTPGPERIVTTGGGATIQVYASGVDSTLPAASIGAQAERVRAAGQVGELLGRRARVPRRRRVERALEGEVRRGRPVVGAGEGEDGLLEQRAVLRPGRELSVRLSGVRGELDEPLVDGLLADDPLRVGRADRELVRAVLDDPGRAGRRGRSSHRRAGSRSRRPSTRRWTPGWSDSNVKTAFSVPLAPSGSPEIGSRRPSGPLRKVTTGAAETVTVRVAAGADVAREVGRPHGDGVGAGLETADVVAAADRRLARHPLGRADAGRREEGGALELEARAEAWRCRGRRRCTARPPGRRWRRPRARR